MFGKFSEIFEKQGIKFGKLGITYKVHCALFGREKLFDVK